MLVNKGTKTKQMARLPQPGSDQGTWGAILNEFLEQAHNTDGTLRDISQSQVTGLAADLDAKAPLNSPAFTGTPTGITKAHVGLGNVDNTPDSAKPISSATQGALDAKAPLNSPAFTGTPTGITKTHVGLENVDNTADSAKPISSATQTALDTKVNGPTSAIDNRIARMDGTTGKIIQSSSATIDDTGKIETLGQSVMLRSTYNAAFMHEVSGEVVDFGTNFFQHGLANTAHSGAYFRIDTRPAMTSQLFTVQYQATPNGQTNYEYTALQLSTTGYLRTGSGLRLSKANDTPTTDTDGILFGADTNLYRSAANTLKTDDNFEVTGNIAVTGTVDGIDVSTLATTVTGKADALDSDFALSVALGNISGVLNLSSYARPALLRGTLTGNIASITLPTIAANRGMTLTLILTQDATGSRTITWPTAKAAYGIKPTLSTAPNATDVIHLSWDGGSWWVTAGILAGM